MKRIRQNIDIKEALNMKVRVSIDDRVVIDKRADSLVANFIRLLYTQAGANDSTGGYFDSNDQRSSPDQRRTVITNDRSKKYGGPSSRSGIEILDKSSPAKIDLDPNNENGEIDLDESTKGLVNIWTKSPNFSGFYSLSRDADGTGRESRNVHEPYLWNVSIDPVTNEITPGSEVDLSSADLSAFNGDANIDILRRRAPNPDRDIFSNPQIFLDRSYDGEAISLEDKWCQDNINSIFEQTGTSVAAPAVSTNESEIEFSESFTNNLPYDLPVNAVALTVEDDRRERLLIARDPASFTIPSSSTVTITYFFTISNSGAGGVMSQFNELLYRQFATANRELVDIFNNNVNNNYSSWNFRMIGPGGDSRYGEFEGSNPFGRNIGPVVGASTTSVSNTDFALQDTIPHGESDGKLFHYGSAVEDIQIEPANGKAYFDVVRIFENRGSTSIDVNETGVYCASAGRDDQNPDSTHLLARHVLGSTQSVAPGELLKLSYRFEVNV